MKKLHIRPASIDDSQQIATLFMKVWHTSLADIVPTGFLDQFDHNKQKQKYAERALDKKWIVLVADSENGIVGMVGATDNNSEPFYYEKAIRSMYVAPEFQNKALAPSCSGNFSLS